MGTPVTAGTCLLHGSKGKRPTGQTSRRVFSEPRGGADGDQPGASEEASSWRGALAGVWLVCPGCTLTREMLSPLLRG